MERTHAVRCAVRVPPPGGMPPTPRLRSHGQWPRMQEFAKRMSMQPPPPARAAADPPRRRLSRRPGQRRRGDHKSIANQCPVGDTARSSVASMAYEPPHDCRLVTVELGGRSPVVHCSRQGPWAAGSASACRWRSVDPGPPLR